MTPGAAGIPTGKAPNGFDLTANVRPRQGVLLQGGVSTGKTLTDNCEILAKLPEITQLGVPYCHQETPFLTQMKLFGAYTLPKVDVQISGAFQSIPGPQLAANQVIPNAQIKPSLGRDLVGGAANVTVNLVPPGSMFGERLNQLDLRFAKLLRFGQTRLIIATFAKKDLRIEFASLGILDQTIFQSVSSIAGAKDCFVNERILTRWDKS
jgi:hypothetical protein